MDGITVVLFIVVIMILIWACFYKEDVFHYERNLELYYDLCDENMRDPVIVNFKRNDDENLIYCSDQHAYMTDSNFVKNKDMIFFFGVRTAGNQKYNIPSVYKEKVIIKLQHGDYVEGVSIYNDHGDGFKTIGVPYVDYEIGSKSGVFRKYNKIRIYIDNINNVRKVVFF